MVGTKKITKRACGAVKERMEAILSGKPPMQQTGFVLSDPASLDYTDEALFVAALEDAKNRYAFQPVPAIEDVALNGEVFGTGLRLTVRAFGDLCHLTGVPVAFVKSISKQDEELALDIMRTRIAWHFPRNSVKSFLVDTVDNLIMGIVGSESYKTYHNLNAYHDTKSTLPATNFAWGSVQGFRTRFALTTSKDYFIDSELQEKGDIMQSGVVVMNSVDGDLSARVAQYWCKKGTKDGMTLKVPGLYAAIMHRALVVEKFQEAVATASVTAVVVADRMQEVAKLRLTVASLASLEKFITTHKKGNAALAELVLKDAETQMDVVKNTMHAASEAKNHQQQEDMEALCFDVLNHKLANTVLGE